MGRTSRRVRRVVMVGTSGLRGHSLLRVGERATPKRNWLPALRSPAITQPGYRETERPAGGAQAECGPSRSASCW